MIVMFMSGAQKVRYSGLKMDTLHFAHPTNVTWKTRVAEYHE